VVRRGLALPALRKGQVNRVLHKAKANADRVHHAAIAHRAKAAVIKADQIARAKALPPANKAPGSRVQLNKALANKVNPPDSNSTVAVSEIVASAADHNRVVNAAAIAVRVHRLRDQRACSVPRLNSLPRNLAAGRNRLAVPAAGADKAAAVVLVAAAKAAPAAIKVRAAAVAADAVGNRADAATNRASSWPKPSRSQSFRCRTR